MMNLVFKSRKLTLENHVVGLFLLAFSVPETLFKRKSIKLTVYFSQEKFSLVMRGISQV